MSKPKAPFITPKERQYIVARMRQVFGWSALKKERMKYLLLNEAWCYLCKKALDRWTSELEHVEPVQDPDVAQHGYDQLAERLFCDPENLKLACIECHRAKTQAENKRRAATRRRLKGEEQNVG